MKIYPTQVTLKDYEKFVRGIVLRYIKAKNIFNSDLTRTIERELYKFGFRWPHATSSVVPSGTQRFLCVTVRIEYSKDIIFINEPI